jgi:hypothetical protein
LVRKMRKYINEVGIGYKVLNLSSIT